MCKFTSIQPRSGFLHLEQLLLLLSNLDLAVRNVSFLAVPSILLMIFSYWARPSEVKKTFCLCQKMQDLQSCLFNDPNALGT